jgi:hypothetical protein
MKNICNHDRTSVVKFLELRHFLLCAGIGMAGLFLAADTAAGAGISAVWANEGGDKVAREELRVGNPNGRKVLNSCWNGTNIMIFGAKNEVVNFNLVIEAATQSATNVSVSFNMLTGPSNAVIQSAAVTSNGVFNWVGRNIELFYVRYLQIKGLSMMGNYDPRQSEFCVPARLRRPCGADGQALPGTTWQDRPDHDKFYPAIAVPLELVPTFTIAAGQNQSIWVDIYIPKGAVPGLYSGNLVVHEQGSADLPVPVQLTVYAFSLPDTPNAETMLTYTQANIDDRYLGSNNVYLDSATPLGQRGLLIQDRHHMLAHRHRISLMYDDKTIMGAGDSYYSNIPPVHSIGQLQGTLFTATNGYDGPGVNTPNGVMAIGNYASFSTDPQTSWSNADAVVSWFDQNAPDTTYFEYLIDEAPTGELVIANTWAQWIKNDPGIGKRLKSFLTMDIAKGILYAPDANIVCFTWCIVPPPQTPQTAQADADTILSTPGRELYCYNGERPANGAFITEEDGVALRVNPWAQFKKHISRYFYWESTYYYDFQVSGRYPNLFQDACTFGYESGEDPSLGESGYAHSNGDGVLFYPGTDTRYPQDSYGVDGPFASLRLKYWRRGIQDVDYLTMAANVDPAAVQQIVNSVIPDVLWEVGDPLTEVSWSTDPDVWEAARAQLAAIIARKIAPVVIGAEATGIVGNSFAFNIIASNNPTGYAALNLPAGLSVNATNGVISGTPTATGTVAVTISATNETGSGSATLTLTINPVLVPVITSSTNATATAGIPFRYDITATNYPTSFGATNLPPGLSIYKNTYAIMGTPASAGTNNIAISAANIAGSGTAVVVLTVYLPPLPVITSSNTATGTVGAWFSYDITATNPVTSFGAPNLPAGLALDPNSGIITGRPETDGTNDVTITASNAAGIATVTLTLTIAPRPPKGPYLGTPWPIPGLVEAENYNTGGEGVSYHDSDPGNNGGEYRNDDVDISSGGSGYAVGWTYGGEWLEYTVNVARPGTYKLSASVASALSGGSFNIEFNGVDATGPITVPNTGGWGSFTSVSTNVTLSAGTQVMRLVMDGSGIVGNFDWISFAGAGEVIKFVQAGMSVGSTNCCLGWSGATDVTNNFAMYRRTNLLAGSWQLVAPGIVRSGTGTNMWIDTNLFPQAFYRVAVPMQ